MTADRSKGVIVWVEGNIIRRLDFTVDEAGIPTPGQPVTILPLAGEEALPGDELHYEVGDVWGDATHDSLYITVKRQESFNSGPNAGAGTRVGLIYDLNTLTNVNDSPAVRTIFDQFIPSDEPPEYPNWLDAGDPSTLPDCYAIPYPQFVPTCYVVGFRMTFNPSGTHLYLERNLKSELRSEGEVYRGIMRIKTDDMAAGLPLADWDLSGPEMVYAVDQLFGGETGGAQPRPENDPMRLPSPEYIAMSHNEDSDNPTSEVMMILNADQCAAVYAPYVNGTLEAPSNLWQECKDKSTLSYNGSLPGGGWTWQSPEALLKLAYQGDGVFNIHRFYVSGALAGTEQLVIENAINPDAGY